MLASPQLDFPIFEFYIRMGLICGTMSLVFVIVLEAVFLCILKWQTFWRSFCDSLLVNLVTTVLGLLLLGLGVSIKGRRATTNSLDVHPHASVRRFV